MKKSGRAGRERAHQKLPVAPLVRLIELPLVLLQAGEQGLRRAAIRLYLLRRLVRHHGVLSELLLRAARELFELDLEGLLGGNVVRQHVVVLQGRADARAASRLG